MTLDRFDLRGLVAVSHRERLRAVHGAPVDATARTALRRVLYTDPHAEVRAAAARRLVVGADRPAELEGWLVDALGDRSPLVRDAIVRALARLDGASATTRTALRALIAGDRMWWVRRAAIYALAALAGDAELTALAAALADPFWRVRHAAIRVLGALGARDLATRDAIADAIAAGTDEVAPANALAFLRSSWGPTAIEAPQRAASTTSLLPAALLDPDPAVVTARLAADPDVTPLALVELLCDPHVPLRLLAVERLVASRDREALIAALDWLEAARIPHVADTVEALLDGLGDDAVVIAEHALARADRPGAARWAIAWVAATDYEPLAEAALARARADRALRAIAVPLAESAELLAWAADEREANATTAAIAAELAARRDDDDLLALLPDAPRVRALQLDARGRRGDLDALRAALADPHPAARALATRYLVHAGELAGDAQLADPDPAVREAALTARTAPAAVGDRDPFVARAAIERLAITYAYAPEAPADAIAAAAAALADRDPFVRARACAVAIHDRDPATLARVVELLADRDDGVRAAALDACERGHDVAARLLALATGPAGTASDTARAMAFAYLFRDLDDRAGELARAALASVAVAMAPRTHAVLAGVAGIELPARPAIELDDRPPPAEAPPARVATRRRFGRLPFEVAPLAISGAFDLAPAALQRAHRAGVDLFFWEPSYQHLTRFLRTTADAPERARVIAGSYHAEPEAIEADVDRARRLLRRDTLDVFLLFWSRSSARIDPAAHEVLARLQRANKIRAAGFSTHHRELARDAIVAAPWDVVMIRHSAAHPGIESVLLPTARAHDTAILTFSALCYGRMLAGDGAPSAADCYRYTLAQPGVTACISAPRTGDELEENLGVLATPTLDAARLEALRAHGARVRVESQRFNTLVRQPTRDAAAAARDMLATELPPPEIVEARPLPTPGRSRGARTHLGRARRGRQGGGS